MNTRPLSRMVLTACLLSASLTGCVANLQSDVGGQTMPSAYYLLDDVQYFPAGPETRLPNLRRALERYKLEQQAEQEQGP